MTTYVSIPTAWGAFLLAGRDGTVTHTWLPPDARPRPDWRRSDDDWRDATTQVEEYLAGDRRRFDLPLAPEGSPFQRRVWDALRAIPHGETRSYGQIARALGDPGAARAVGAANGRNPIPLLIPCHRVVAADGTLGGFSGSLAVKEALLVHEGAWPRQGALFG